MRVPVTRPLAASSCDLGGGFLICELLAVCMHGRGGGGLGRLGGLVLADALVDLVPVLLRALGPVHASPLLLAAPQTAWRRSGLMHAACHA